MDNWLKHQKELKALELQKTQFFQAFFNYFKRVFSYRSIHLDQQKRNRHFKNNVLSLRSKTRIESWVHDNEMMKSVTERIIFI